MNEIFLQAFYYGIVITIVLLFVGMFLRGFFMTYIKVRTSFGKYVLIKIRTPLRDYFAKGWVEENFLVYKSRGEILRLNMDKNAKIFYRSLGVNWVDVDEEKNAICKVDYEPVTGFDSRKFSDLLTRALMRPTISSGQEKVILVCVILAVIISLAAAYIAYMDYVAIKNLSAQLPSIVQAAIQQGKGTVIAGANLT